MSIRDRSEAGESWNDEVSGPRPRPQPRRITPPAGTVLLEPGTTLEGKYVVLKLIGAGGSAVVYEAEHLALGRKVAIKVVCSDADPERVLERFRREARTCGALRHTNIAEVFDVGDLGDGTPFLVMELLEGVSLEERMQESPLPLPAVVEVARQTLAGLEAVHRTECLHRDIKPHNIVLHREADGEIVAKLVDFGISKPLGRAAMRHITEEGLIIGTPHYMSPEQARGLDLDARTDLYSLGVVLYELITGVAPFDEPTVTGLLTAVLRDPVPLPSSISDECPPELEAIVLRAMSRDREERFQTASEMADALAAVAESLGYPEGQDAWASPAVQRAGSAAPQQRTSRPPVQPRDPAISTPETVAALASTQEAEPMEGAPFSERGALLPPRTRAVRSRRRALAAGAGGLALATLFLAWNAVGAIAGSFGADDAVATGNAAPAATPTDGIAHAQPAPIVPPQATGPSASGAALAVASSRLADPEPARPAAVPPPSAARADAEPVHATARRRPIAGMLEASSPQPPAHHRSQSDQLSDEALASYVRGSLPRARTLYRRAASADPRNATAWRGLGLASYRLGARAEAVQALHRYLALRPRAPDAPRIRAILFTLRAT